MKKMFLIVAYLLLMLPVIIKADERYCKYQGTNRISVTQGNQTTTLYLYFECNESSCVSNRTEYSSTFYDIPIGNDKVMNLTSCPNVISISSPPSSPVGLLTGKDSCSGSPEYGCYPLVENKLAYTPPPPPLEDSDKYGDIISCRDVDYKYIKDCGCMPAALTDLTSRLYMLIKIAAPALLLIIGGFDLIKAMSAQDESAINKARQKLVRKFIAAAAVFLIFTLVQFIVSTLASDSTSTMKCVDYLLNGYVA